VPAAAAEKEVHMSKRIAFILLILVLGSLLVAGCGGDSSVSDQAAKQISAAKAALADATAKGVQVPDNEKKKIGQAESKLESDSVQALILATEAKTEINSDIQDAFNVAESTYNVCKGTAEGAISTATAGADLTQAKQSLANAEAKKDAAKTIPDWYNPSDGPIYWANLAAQQASAASLAKATTAAEQQAAAQAQKMIEQGSVQMNNLMRNWLTQKGDNPADYKIGIQKLSASDPAWATGAATLIAPVEGSQPVSFLFHYENGNWVLKAAPSWTQGQFGAPADMMP
jgi:outer membrane lipoprotein-sorting protein